MVSDKLRIQWKKMFRASKYFCIKCYGNGILKNVLFKELLSPKVYEKVKVLNFAESKDQDKFGTGTMVAILVILVTSFFVFFALMAVCYRFVLFKQVPSNGMYRWMHFKRICIFVCFTNVKWKWKKRVEVKIKCLLDVLSTMCWC